MQLDPHLLPVLNLVVGLARLFLEFLRRPRKRRRVLRLRASPRRLPQPA